MTRVLTDAMSFSLPQHALKRGAVYPPRPVKSTRERTRRPETAAMLRRPAEAASPFPSAGKRDSRCAGMGTGQDRSVRQGATANWRGPYRHSPACAKGRTMASGWSPDAGRVAHQRHGAEEWNSKYQPHIETDPNVHQECRTERAVENTASGRPAFPRRYRCNTAPQGVLAPWQVERRNRIS